MQPSGEFSLYIHVPFCTKKCDYCHFYVIPDKNIFKEIYIRSLKKEWELRRPMLLHKKLVSLYFGGGTPSLLGPQAIEEIISWINPSPQIEITLEVNPENVTLSTMQAFKKAGINRVSLGVQSLEESHLQILSRTHTSSQSVRAIEATYAAGIENISIDLMYDLPNQTLSSFQNTLQKATQLPISHLALYNLSIEPHTVFYKKRDSLQLPDASTSLEMHNTAIQTLSGAGFTRYEIAAFAKQELTSKHNIGYWTERPFLGLGPSAFSYWNCTRFQNIANLQRYAKMLEKEELPTHFSEKLSSHERLKESLAVGLRMIKGVPLAPYTHLIPHLVHLQELNLIKFEKERVLLTEKGLLFHDTVAEGIMNVPKLPSEHLC